MTPEEKREIRLIRRRKWYSENKEKHKEKSAIWYAKNKDSLKVKFAKYYKENRERIKSMNAAWRAANAERLKAYHKKSHIQNRARNIAKASSWKAKNKERAAATNSAIYQRNKESRKRINKIWRTVNKDVVRGLKVKRRAVLLSAMPDNITKSEQFEMRFLYGLRRALSMGGTEHHVDHIIPLSRGGLHHPSNLRIVPAIVNMRKWAKLIAA